MLNVKLLERYRFQMLLGVLLVSFAILPFFERRLFTELMATVILIFALWAISNARKILLACVLLVISTIAAIWYAHWFPSKAIIVAANLLDIVFLVLVIGAILFGVFQSRQITRESIAGAICAYLLIGATWADAFSVLEILIPGSFSGVTNVDLIGNFEAARFRVAQFHYFSFVTLTTLGYGDITPLTRPARNFAALEAIFGQLYLAVLIARLVSQQGSSNRTGSG